MSKDRYIHQDIWIDEILTSDSLIAQIRPFCFTVQSQH